MKITTNLSLAFSAGCLGGLANSLLLWVLGDAGVTAFFGVKMAPSLTAAWLYPRIVWGGLWGVLFIVPFTGQSIFFRGLLLSMGPTLVQLFAVFPMKLGKGQMGLALGALTPVFVVVLNAVWGIVGAMWMRVVRP